MNSDVTSQHLLAGATSEQQEFFRAWSACRPTGSLMPRLADYLDAPAVRLQGQVAIGDVYSQDDIRLRLFGGGLADMAGEDHTQRGVDALMTPEVKAAARPFTWTAVHRPCGYRSLLTVRTPTGLVASCPTISLPLVPPKGPPFCIMAMIQLPDRRIKPPADAGTSFVNGFQFENWIDIGAGVPRSNTGSDAPPTTA